MKITLGSASDIGPLVRATRKALGLRQDDTAGTIGVSENFLGKVERGDDSVQWSKLFQVLDQLGIRLTAEIPEQARALHEAETKKLETRRSDAN
ncbi:transcriptional regulator [Pseudomonas sp. Choline-3u-10]|uniref:helix-turn-helix domain-containing protein n=1 Tax=Pseudomonadaceae TaxID=135621 RepID=UPI000C32B6F2|nr:MULTISPECIES: helix-turn-helix domain-containing protein [Pseudomonadaceae]PKG96332.1 transcriptional regulator [Pseudomonas sp. Choline-3u-10]